MVRVENVEKWRFSRIAQTGLPRNLPRRNHISEIRFSLIAESYRREAYTEAINILILTFSLIHNLEDVMLLDIIGSCPESFCSDKPKSIETVHSRRNRLTVLLN